MSVTVIKLPLEQHRSTFHPTTSCDGAACMVWICNLRARESKALRACVMMSIIDRHALGR